MLHRLLYLLPLFVLCTCHSGAPPKTIRLPAAISEASGLSIQGDAFTWHNDSGDEAVLYTTDQTGRILMQDTLQAPASDNEDMTQDESGNIYLGDFGNNRGQRKQMQVYRYAPAKGQTDTINFTYPGQDGRGRNFPGNPDCEAMIFHQGQLHLFTKDQLLGKGRFYTYHYRIPAEPGNHIAELVDSLYLPNRVVTAAALDPVKQELVLTAYNFKYFLGFWPSGAASLITLKDYPECRFLQGKVKRRNLAWFWPTQFEAIAIYNDRWLYVGSEATKLRKHAVGKRKRRR